MRRHGPHWRHVPAARAQVGGLAGVAELVVGGAVVAVAAGEEPRRGRPHLVRPPGYATHPARVTPQAATAIAVRTARTSAPPSGATLDRTQTVLSTRPPAPPALLSRLLDHRSLRKTNDRSRLAWTDGHDPAVGDPGAAVRRRFAGGRSVQRHPRSRKYHPARPRVSPYGAGGRGPRLPRSLTHLGLPLAGSGRQRADAASTCFVGGSDVAPVAPRVRACGWRRVRVWVAPDVASGTVL